MPILNNFLTSNHTFSPNENLIKFRFSLLNSILSIAIFFTLLNYLASVSGFIILNDISENVLIPYMLITTYLIYLLRKKKESYMMVANILIITSLIIFHITLFTDVSDELRLIWFFLILFISFVLLGKIYGLIIMLFILTSILTITQFHDLGYSTLALFTFINSFIIFGSFAYFFLEKIEKDAKEFTVLNNQLKEKVSKEVEHRKEQEQMLLHQSRLAGMGEMIDSIAHQWRQPLMNINAILMNIDRAIETKDKSPEYILTKMNEVTTLTTHMSQTIEDFRSLFKEDKKKDTFYIDESITYALHLMESSLQNIEVTIIVSKNISCYGYKNELIQVFMIFISNATEVLAIRKIEKKHIKIVIEENKKYITITIEDNAGGIKESYLTRVFDPYFTTKKATGGTGLGLYVAKIIIEQNMHGTLRLANTDRGARFTIAIPRV